MALYSAAMRIRTAALLCLLALAGGCGRARGRQAARELPGKVKPVVAKLAGVPESQIDVELGHEVLTYVYTAKADAKNGPPFRCFVDVTVAFCARDTSILGQLVAHRRLGDNRGSLTDTQWVDLVVTAAGLEQTFGQKHFELPPGTTDAQKAKLDIPKVDRRDEGSLYVDVYGTDGAARLVRVRAGIHGDSAQVAVEPVK